MVVRYIEKFESIAGDLSYAFSLNNYEAQEEQAFRTAYSQGIAADYAFDHVGYRMASKALSTISIRATSVETSEANLEAEIDEAQSECERIGLGYLYRLESDASTRRRCLARCEGKPSITRAGFQSVHMPIMFRFTRLSEWQATSATTGSATVTTSPYSLTVTNAGNLWVKTGFTIDLTAITAAGITDPSVFNQTTGQRVSTTRDAGVAYASVRFDGGKGVYYARPGFYIGGTAYIGAAGIGSKTFKNDNALATLGTQQGVLWLKPGVNQLLIEVGGTPNYSLSYTFYGSYA